MTNSRKHEGLVTAYASNTRKKDITTENVYTEWAPEINELLKMDHSFLGYKYSTNGILFRGMSSGLTNAVADDSFGLYQDNKPHSELEQSLKVFFVSHELSDAVTSSRIWQDSDDAAIIILSSDYYNECYDNHIAAMLAFAEPGFVFKYPFFIQALNLENIEYLVLNQLSYSRLERSIQKSLLEKILDKLIVIDNSSFTSPRAEYELAIHSALIEQGLKYSSPVETDDFPKK